MASRAAADFNFYLERGKIELVVKDGDVFRLKLAEIHCCADAAAAIVHERRGLEKDDFVGTNSQFLNPAQEFLGRYWKIVNFGKRIERHETDIVPVHRIGGAWITETYP
jgi:hypothetical protein